MGGPPTTIVLQSGFIREDGTELADGWEWTEHGAALGESWRMRRRTRWLTA